MLCGEGLRQCLSSKSVPTHPAVTLKLTFGAFKFFTVEQLQICVYNQHH